MTDDRLEHRRRMETNMTAAQRANYRRNRGLLRDVLDIALATVEVLPDAYMGAALTTVADTPGSGWGGGIPAKGTVSDPTGQAVVNGQGTSQRPGPDAQLSELERLIRGWRDAGYPIHELATRMAARLEPDKGSTDWRGDSVLDDVNMGRGTCKVCDKHCDGATKATRLHTIRTDPELKACNACRVSWDEQVRRDQGTDVWVWCELRRKRIERTDGKEAS